MKGSGKSRRNWQPGRAWGQVQYTRSQYSFVVIALFSIVPPSTKKELRQRGSPAGVPVLMRAVFNASNEHKPAMFGQVMDTLDGQLLVSVERRRPSLHELCHRTLAEPLYQQFHGRSQ